MVFDILNLDGKDLRKLPLVERKTILQKLLNRPPAGVLYSQHITGRGPKFHKIAFGRQLEGIVSKRANSPYRSGRGASWEKVKCALRQEFVIAGYRYASNGSHDLGSLLIGYYDHGKFIYAGSVGTGWSRQARPLDHRCATAYCRRIATIRYHPGPDVKGSHWAEPETRGGGAVHRVDKGRESSASVLQGPAGGQARQERGAGEAHFVS